MEGGYNGNSTLLPLCTRFFPYPALSSALLNGFVQRPIGIKLYRRSDPRGGEGNHRGIITAILSLRHKQRNFFPIRRLLQLPSQTLIIGNAARDTEAFKCFHAQYLSDFANKRIDNRRLVGGAN